MRPRLYTASNLEIAPLWLELRDKWPDIEFTARWIDHHLDAEFDPKVCERFWVEDMEDVRRSTAIVVYGLTHEKLRGALVEAGMAIAYGLQIIVAGEHPDYGTWQYHPSVVRLKNVFQVRSYLLQRSAT